MRGSEEHPGLWWRSAACNDLRRECWSLQRDVAPGERRIQRPLPSRHYGERHSGRDFLLPTLAASQGLLRGSGVQAGLSKQLTGPSVALPQGLVARAHLAGGSWSERSALRAVALVACDAQRARH